ncbi:DsbA family oxidoreductase [Adhaeribacter sp. BT258]|uniref:DsbA family oxidoreductase n=1 Tax=Adhaeribacter terrigena TaxID=2793070 RepID=A0ABS1C0R0_9BACT|nr:DsbA family oxidoreductase [Adhaeribacter terrigena]MBK0402756.1 DsbA family oxidoreductase [Adhaeribacter terrigena]
MKVEIWSDVVCPFCYIGKRKFEAALKDFPHKDEVEITWRSFQLDPEAKPVPGQSVHEYLAKRKGVSVQEGKQMNDYMAGAAKEVGLQYNFDKAIITNTLDAHRLLHFAKEQGKQNELKERLFAAYYTEGRDLGDKETLAELAETVGLNKEKVKAMLQTDAYKEAVQMDQYEAQQVGARGVPFFVFNNRYAISGAQPIELFQQTLDQTWNETEKPKPTPIAGDPNANACNLDGSNC